MASNLEQTGAIKILLYLYNEGPKHRQGIIEEAGINAETLSRALDILRNSDLVIQVIETRGKTKSRAYVQRLTIEGRKVAEHLQEIDKIVAKKTLNITK